MNPWPCWQPIELNVARLTSTAQNNKGNYFTDSGLIHLVAIEIKNIMQVAEKRVFHF